MSDAGLAKILAKRQNNAENPPTKLDRRTVVTQIAELDKTERERKRRTVEITVVQAKI